MNFHVNLGEGISLKRNLGSSGFLTAKGARRPTRATVHLLDPRAMSRVDIGVFIGAMLWALLESLSRNIGSMIYQ